MTCFAGSVVCRSPSGRTKRHSRKWNVLCRDSRDNQLSPGQNIQQCHYAGLVISTNFSYVKLGKVILHFKPKTSTSRNYLHEHYCQFCLFCLGFKVAEGATFAPFCWWMSGHCVVWWITRVMKEGETLSLPFLTSIRSTRRRLPRGPFSTLFNDLIKRPLEDKPSSLTA